MNRVFLSACPSYNHPPIQLFVLILSLLESTCISCKSSILTILRMLSIVMCCLVRVFYLICYLIITLIGYVYSTSVFFESFYCNIIIFVIFYVYMFTCLYTI